MINSPNRQKALQQLAHQLELDYQAEDVYNLTAQLSDFRLFRKGGSKRVYHILRKQDELMAFDVRIFDYRYLRYAGKRMKRHEQTVFFLHSTQLGLPEIWMQPENILHKIGELLGMEDIDFVRFPKFSGQYRLTGDDEDFVRHHFTDEVLNYFTLEKGWYMEGVGYYLVLYKKDRVLSPKEIGRFYQQGMEVFRMLSDKDAQYKLFGS